MPLLLRYSVRSLAARRTRALATVAVVALVVVATALLSSLVSSFTRTLVTSGSDRNLIVLSKGAASDAASALPLEAVQVLRDLPGVALDGAGRPLVSPELVAQPLLGTQNGRREAVVVRGIESTAFGVHEDIRIVRGRRLEPSQGEAIVGRQIAGRHSGAEVERDLHVGGRSWRIVGVFDSGGSSFESEVWVDARELAADAKRRLPYSSIRVRMASSSDRDVLTRRIDSEQRLALEAKPEIDYYREQATSADTLYAIVLAVAGLAGLAALFGAANTLYAAVRARRAEIGTLRVLGFSRRTVLAAFLAESLLLSALGFAVGALAAPPLAAGMSRLMGGVRFSGGLLSTNIVVLRVGWEDLALALVLALSIGLLGGLPPAARAAQLRPAEALRRV